jgi:DNA repair protein RecN (Recombination protein N)
MLAELNINDIVLIDNLHLELGPGLNVLTGETGAGKSILLDSLGLATGARADKGLVRHGRPRGSVSALFEVPQSHVTIEILKDHDISLEDTKTVPVILRRVQSSDGRSRAYINDEPVSIGLLRQVGELLLEVHGQHDERGLLDASNHRKMLDDFGGLSDAAKSVERLFGAVETNQKALDGAIAEIADVRAQVDYYEHVLAELEELAPQGDEEEDLAAARSLMMHAEKVSEEIDAANRHFIGSQGIDGRLSSALRKMEGVSDKAGGKLDPAIDALGRALAEVDEARTALSVAQREISFDPDELERVEERLFGLRAGARKHNVRVDDLPRLIVQFQQKLEDAASGEEKLDELEKALEAAKAQYTKAATDLSAARARAAKGLDRSVAKELPPLKLEKASFRTAIETGETFSAHGFDKIHFEISTNPGTPFAPLVAIASGGELARIVLALKVSLASKGSAGSLVFDEVDQGIGGAVADAVGERLARLATGAQVLVVTHSPQVAARASHHWRIRKSIRKGPAKNGKKSGDEAATQISSLGDTERLEEIARMLSGAEITDEARAAADRLITAGAGK